MAQPYTIESLGHHELPEELSLCSAEDVEDVLRRAAAFLGWHDVAIERVWSVVPGSCIACEDVVASAGGVPMLVARPAL